MHLRRVRTVAAPADPDPSTVWDDLPGEPAGEVVIRAPRAGDLVAPAPAVPVRAA